MKLAKITKLSLAVLLLLLVAADGAYLLVERFRHVDMTQLRFFLTYWKQYLGLVVLLMLTFFSFSRL
jgi:hypothetical protein